MRDIINAIISDDHFLRCKDYSIARNGEGLTPCLSIVIPAGLYKFWAYIDFKKPNGETFKTPRIDVDEGKIIYNIPSGVLDDEGQLEVQVVFQNADGEIWKTYVKEFAVRYSINATDDIPDKPDFITEAQKLLDEAVATAKSVEERANNGEFDGADGKDGYTPIKGIDYFDGEQGVQGIQGEKGEKGDKGDTGATGAQGEQGVQGNDGYTPKRGVDYWTLDDVKEMHNYIDELFNNEVKTALEGDY